MKKITDLLFSTRAAGLYMLAFAIAIGVATFIENDFGTSSAQKVVFRARWFEILMLLFAGSIITNVIRYRMIQQKKWALLMFHLSIIVILLGAGITRYFGYEGMMHIREGSSSNTFMSEETYLQIDVDYQGNQYSVDEKVYFATLGNNTLKRSYQFGDKVAEVEVAAFIPNPERELTADESGKPVVKLVIAGDRGREDHFLRLGDIRRVGSILFNFNNSKTPGAVNIYFRNDSLLFDAPFAMTSMRMATQAQDSVAANRTGILMPRTLYSNDKVNFVLADFSPSARVELVSTGAKMRNESLAALLVKVRTDGREDYVYTYGNKGRTAQPVDVAIGDMKFSIAYGPKDKELPFAIELHDFQLERYPGTNSASSYASEVSLIDNRDNTRFNYRIYMNNILNYDGYRFFQSSYDQDELGTVLSVNHDFWGTIVSYIGYFLLTLGLILSFFSKKSRFQFLGRQVREMRLKRATAIIALIVATGSVGLMANGDGPNPDAFMRFNEDHIEKFSHVLVQDHKGRIKPMQTQASEILRKLSRKESMYGMSSDEMFLSMSAYPDAWLDVPLIKVGRHDDLKKMLGVEEGLAAFSDFFGPEGDYILMEDVRRAHNLDPIDRGKFEKEIIKVDERVNILNMVFGRRLMRIYPVPGDENNLWLAPGDVSHTHKKVEQSNEFMEKFYPAYTLTIDDALESGDWSLPNQLIDELHEYQHQYGSEVVLSDRKVNLEIALNRAHIFARLGRIYALLGFGFLIMFFTTVLKPSLYREWMVKAAFTLLGVAFIAHTAGLGIRWYVSGHAPWSNGYESMIYIAWTTILAGLIFSRKSLGGMAATSVLSSIILLVAGLSWMDPEITPLVPVLKSYWLTIHVSLEAGSYGFLMLGAIIGCLNLMAIGLINSGNSKRIMHTVKELSYVSEMTLIGGLVMISVGTYLGGVWANESWGRYWGWDAKETWALVTILVYAFILHMRLIPGLRGLLAFNIASLFGFFSVMMTYFGVNYYLSGLHSYATGDPAPIPTFVYYTVAGLVLVSLLAAYKHRKFVR